VIDKPAADQDPPPVRITLPRSPLSPAHHLIPLIDLYWAEKNPYYPFTLAFTPSNTNFSPVGPV
jgi:hypothetical protein